MTVTIHFLLYVLAFLCFVAATFNYPARVNLVALGLAIWVLTFYLI
jgi:hypothetical protein